MPFYKWALHLLFFAAVVGSGLGFSLYYQAHYTASGERTAISEDNKPPKDAGSVRPAGSRLPDRNLDGDLVVVVLATRLLDESDGELETQLRAFLKEASHRLVGGNARVIGKGGTELWPAVQGQRRLWEMVEGFKPDEADLAFAALFAELRALQARAARPVRTLVLWKCDRHPDDRALQSLEPPPGMSLSLFWLWHPDYPRATASPCFQKWFGPSVWALGRDVQDLSNSLLYAARSQAPDRSR